ncbi:replication initiator [Mycobacteroides abscessus]|uniref:replication initiator n=1 Tax=Mycobacteroides abscessus TaxID=36809 RepID=UPI00266B4BED|nr:replication initiator [Mycobacteroides abscessus]MDO2971159.1 replication initiator protein [Mycobacteroides abscessus subsp. bolletii]MDO3078543.1 replication initiator protein [Mycobacteroides abscessus subsp. bolletii]
MTIDTLESPDSSASVLARRERAADRRARPSFHEIAVAAAEKVGVCVRPLVMGTVNLDTGATDYVAVPCKSTVESQCPTCAKNARLLRMTQCREGWHLDHEPVQPANPPTAEQTALLRSRADLIATYRAATTEDHPDPDTVAELRLAVGDIDTQLRESGMRGTLPSLHAAPKAARTRSTKRRRDAVDLPTRQVRHTTVGREYAGRYRPSMFLTLTCQSYGPIRAGAPVDPARYDYRRAARDSIHFAALVDRFIQNLRRVLGWEVQYFATVEPQKRAAPHLHMALRGAIPHAVVRQVAAATYHQVWWPNHDRLVYTDPNHQPQYNPEQGTFIDPDTGMPLTTWDEALHALDNNPNALPAHVVRFGEQVHSKGILGGSDEAGRHIGYLTKYLTKSISEILEPDTAAQHAHHERLHAELAITPCSPRCPVWFRYGVIPKGATSKTIAGQCKSKAHRRTTLGLPGRRVLVSRKWSGKTLPDHRADREEFVQQLLTDAGIAPPTNNVRIYPIEPGTRTPPRHELIMAAITQRLTWKSQYNTALAALGPPNEGKTTTPREG